MPQMPRPGDGMPDGRAGQMLWYGSLAAVAALGVVEWPVAAVVAAGSYVVDRRIKAAKREQAEEPKRRGSTNRPRSAARGSRRTR
jgi:hypothetical protein